MSFSANIADKLTKRQAAKVEGRIRVLSLFSGCGGMDLGAEGGFEFLDTFYERLPTQIVGALELDPRVADIYKSNFSSQCLVGDIREMDEGMLPKHDLLIGGFPCQSFSISAQNPPRLGHDDERGRLYFEMCRVLQHHKPEAFVAENVKGLLSANKGKAFPLILQEFEASGYVIKWSLLNAADFGVPQRRNRVFIIGFKNSLHASRFRFPEPLTANSPIPLGQILQPADTVPDSFYFSERAIKGLSDSRTTNIMKKGRVQDDTQPCFTVGAHLAKRSLNSTDPVVLTNGRLRMFTPREVARIQSFPENFTLSNVKSNDYRALGNAVPPVLMWHLTNAVIKAMT